MGNVCSRPTATTSARCSLSVQLCAMCTRGTSVRQVMRPTRIPDVSQICTINTHTYQ
jgi:hypothetical protein